MSDNVNKPSHYNAGSVETIDAIKSALGDAFLDYCRGNVIKYVWRCRHKGKLLEDLRKAAKYLEWAIAAMETNALQSQGGNHVEGAWVEEAGQVASTQDSIPDPGPGYRLLSKDPPEPVVKGDEYLAFDGEWSESENWRHGSSPQTERYYYRRKIEPTEWIPKVGDKVRVARGFMNPVGEVGIIKSFCPVVNGNFSILAHEGRCTLGWFKKDDVELIEASS